MIARQALARMWRPHQLSEVIGQDHVINAFTYMLQAQNIHQAILLTGTRGVGKTTLGRILARSVNCEQGIGPNPCGECHACKHIQGGHYTDLIEIDAASRTKVEDTRELLEQTHYQPTHGRYKVFLIDEVHMLSNHSFNALLKTIEEPPKHVLFILATTDPDKLPETILSRCLHFKLHRMQPKSLFAHLQNVLKQEHITYEPNAIDLIVHHAKGSVRDALTLCDQLIAQGQGQVTEAVAVQALGLLPQQTIHALIKACATQNATELMTLFDAINQQHIQWPSMLNALADVLHQLACIHALPQYPCSAELKQLASQCSAELTQLFYQIVTLGQQELHHAPSHTIGGQMILLRMMHFSPELHTTPSLPKRPDGPASDPLPHNHNQQKPSSTSAPSSSKAPTEQRSSMEWSECLSRFCAQGFAHQCFKNSERVIQGQVWTIHIPKQQMAMLTDQRKQRLQQQINEQLTQPIQLKVIAMTDEAPKAPPKTQEAHENVDYLKTVFQ